LGYDAVDSSSFRISHLQFVDDALITREKSWGNIRVLEANLILFLIISGSEFS